MTSPGTSPVRRVLHVLNGAGGGAALSTLGLIRALADLGVESSAYCHDAGTPGEREALRDACAGRVDFGALRIWNKKTRTAAWKRPILEAMQLARTGAGGLSSFQVTAAAARRRADLIHTNTILVTEGATAARVLGRSHVWHVRELVGETFVLPLEGAALGRYLAARSSRVIANSEATASRIAAHLPADVLEVVPNAIDVDAYTTRLHAARAVTVVGMVANLTSRMKRHDLFVRAGAEAIRRGAAIELVIIGHDPSRGGAVRGDAYVDALHDEIATLGLRDRVRFAGFEPDPVRAMAGLDLLVHPFEGESFGRVVIEGMASGLPVVGVRGGGVAETVIDGETGYLAPVGDAAALGEAIARLAADPALRGRFGAAGRARAEARHGLAVHARRVLGVYGAAVRRPLRPFAAPVAA